MPADPSAKQKRVTARAIRWTALISILVISTTLGLLHQHYRDGLFFVVGVDALCPFGGIEVLWSYLTDGAFIKRTAFSSVILLAGTIAAAFMMSRSFCGQICPLGTLQELFARIGIRITGRRMELPTALDRPARFLKYILLLVITYLTWRTATLVIRPYDPWAAYHHITSAEVLTEFAIGLIVLVISIGASVFFDRFFCKYLCPMGAFLGLISRITWFRIERDGDSCTNCGLCDRACPMNIDVSAVDTVRDAECIACNECVTACPVDETLVVSGRTGSRISPLIITVLTLTIFFGIVAATTAANTFEWTKTSGGGGGQDHGETSGQSHGDEDHEEGGGSGQGSDETIRGKTTMNEVAALYGIPAAELQAEFGLAADEMDTPLNTVKAIYGFSMDDVRSYAEANAR